MLAGTNHDEGRLFALLAYPTTFAQLTAASAAAFIAQAAPAPYQQNVSAQYPAANYAASVGGKVFGEISDIWTDAYMLCRTVRALSASASAGARVYQYLFDQVPSCPLQPGVPTTLTGATHGTELPYVFGGFSTPACTFSPVRTTQKMTKFVSPFESLPRHLLIPTFGSRSSSLFFLSDFKNEKVPRGERRGRLDWLYCSQAKGVRSKSLSCSSDFCQTRSNSKPFAPTEMRPSKKLLPLFTAFESNKAGEKAVLCSLG